MKISSIFTILSLVTTESCVQGKLRGRNGQLINKDPSSRRLSGTNFKKEALGKILEGQFKQKLTFSDFARMLFNPEDLSSISPQIIKRMNKEIEGRGHDV
jgi:hypothetical protein